MHRLPDRLKTPHGCVGVTIARVWRFPRSDGAAGGGGTIKSAHFYFFVIVAFSLILIHTHFAVIF
jgi:hypothetical protein